MGHFPDSRERNVSHVVMELQHFSRRRFQFRANSRCGRNRFTVVCVVECAGFALERAVVHDCAVGNDVVLVVVNVQGIVTNVRDWVTVVLGD